MTPTDVTMIQARFQAVELSHKLAAAAEASTSRGTFGYPSRREQLLAEADAHFRWLAERLGYRIEPTADDGREFDELLAKAVA